MITFDTILERYNKGINNNLVTQVKNRYVPSSKVSKISKKKLLISKVVFDIQFKDTVRSSEDTKLKEILTALNKINRDNVNQILDELCIIPISYYSLLNKVTEFVLKKVLNEPNYIDYYLQLVSKLSQKKLWVVEYKEGVVINLEENFLLKLQELFENEIFLCEKGFGIKIVNVLCVVFDKGWINEKIIVEILEFFLGKNDVIFTEYIIVFLKSSQTFLLKNNYIDKVKKLDKLPMRLSFMLDEI